MEHKLPHAISLNMIEQKQVEEVYDDLRDLFNDGLCKLHAWGFMKLIEALSMLSTAKEKYCGNDDVFKIKN